MKKYIISFFIVLVGISLYYYSYFIYNPYKNQTFDIVITNAMIMDPEREVTLSNHNMAINNDSIVVISQKELKGHKMIDAKGRIVAPGFIDILSYDPNSYGVWYKISDGVTTNLLMHGGATNHKTWYNKYKGKVPVNFGAAFFYMRARLQMSIGYSTPATDKQLVKLLKKAEQAILDGALGIGLSLEYAPGTTDKEVLELNKLAAKYNVPVFYHARFSDMEEPGTNFDALNEIIGLSRMTGASAHIDHITSTGGTFTMKESMAMIHEARSQGLDITACAYPYPYWATYLNSARFFKGWQKRFRIGYEDLQLGGTTEILNKESFKKYQKQGKLAVAYAIPEEDVLIAMKDDIVMIGSDGIMSRSLNHHPRAAGGFTRVISKYVKDDKSITLMQALRKMSYLPALRLEQSSSDFEKLGRIKVGAFADLVIFDAMNIQDMATVEKPNQHAKGIDYVIVRGKIVKEEGTLNKKVLPGMAIKNDKALKYFNLNKK